MIHPIVVGTVVSNLEHLLEDSSFNTDTKDQYIQLLHELNHLNIYAIAQFLCGQSEIRLVHQSLLWHAHNEAAKEYRDQRSKEDYLHGIQSCDSATSRLLEVIQMCKPEIKERSLNFLDSSFLPKYSTSDIAGFMNSISSSLQDLLDREADMIPDVKVKIESLKKNLDRLAKVYHVTSMEDNLKDLRIQIQAFACHATCIPLLYWVQDAEMENLEPRMDIILSDLQKKTGLSNLEVTRMYIAGLKALEPSDDDSFHQLVELLKDNLEVDPEQDDIQMLFSDLIFMIRFLMKHQEVLEFAKVISVLEDADAVTNDIASVISLLSSGETKKGIAEERNLLLHASLDKAKAIKAEVRRHSAHLYLYPQSFNFPRINVLDLIDSLLENLNELSLHFQEHHQIMRLQEELLSLKELNLKDFSILELQK